jgi:hypothetical protein
MAVSGLIIKGLLFVNWSSLSGPLTCEGLLCLGLFYFHQPVWLILCTNSMPDDFFLRPHAIVWTFQASVMWLVIRHVFCAAPITTRKRH